MVKRIIHLNLKKGPTVEISSSLPKQHRNKAIIDMMWWEHEAIYAS